MNNEITVSVSFLEKDILLTATCGGRKDYWFTPFEDAASVCDHAKQLCEELSGSMVEFVRAAGGKRIYRTIKF